MDSVLVLTKVFTLFLVILVGVYASKKNILSQEVTNKLSSLVLNIAMPLLIISSFEFDFDGQMLKKAGLVFLGSVIAHLLAILVSHLIYRKYPSSRGQVLKFATIFSNCSFMGYPVLESIFGKIGIFYGSIFVIPFNIISLSYGVMLFTGAGSSKGETLKSLKKALLHPGIIATVIGMVLFLFSIKLPGPVQEAAEMVGSLNSPLAMLIVGALLARYKLSEVFKGLSIYFVSLMRLVIIPLLVYGIMVLLSMPGDVTMVVVILSAMPVAVTTVIFAEQYGADSGLASKSVGVTTLLSIVTIPLFILLLT